MKKHAAVLFFLCTIPLLTIYAEPAAPRVWTNSEGKTLTGTMVDATADTVKIKLKAGNVISLPLITLSQADQDYVTNQPKLTQPVPPTTGPAKPAATTPPASATIASSSASKWPQKVTLKELPEVIVVKEDATTKQFIYQSPHYEFRSPALLGASVVKEFSRIFEVTYEANVALPLKFNPTPESGQERFVCSIYETYEDYIKAGGARGSAGIYTSGDKMIKVPLKSLGVKFFGKKLVLERGEDNSTLIHEITHQMMNHWLGKIPVWYTEGSAEYLTMAKYERGGMSFTNIDKSFQEFIQGRGSDGKLFSMLTLETLLTMDSNTWSAALTGSGGNANRNYASAGALTYYFYHCDDKGDGQHMIDFIRAVEKGDNKIKAVTEHLMRGRTYEKLQDDVEKALRKVGVKVQWGS